MCPAPFDANDQQLFTWCCGWNVELNGRGVSAFYGGRSLLKVTGVRSGRRGAEEMFTGEDEVLFSVWRHVVRQQQHHLVDIAAVHSISSSCSSLLSSSSSSSTLCTPAENFKGEQNLFAYVPHLPMTHTSPFFQLSHLKWNCLSWMATTWPRDLKLRGVVVGASDFWSTDREFDSRGRCTATQPSILPGR